MKLYINTSKKEKIVIKLIDRDKTIEVLEIEAEYRQSERLLTGVDKLINNQGIKLEDIAEITVEPSGESFSALRIGVVTANALAYALGVQVKSSDIKQSISKKGLNIVNPKYSKEPNISYPKKK